MALRRRLSPVLPLYIFPFDQVGLVLAILTSVVLKFFVDLIISVIGSATVIFNLKCPGAVMQFMIGISNDLIAATIAPIFLDYLAG